jgi:membrane-bound serine protease (ClpP class)
MALLLLTARAAAQPTQPSLHVAEITGVINPLSADYLVRVLEGADGASADAVLLRLDTPGGLDTAMRDMIRAIHESRVPVVVYVGPAGARAASAGLFITLAGHVAAMAPGTNIGAAHPVQLGGEGTDDVMTGKVTNDAAAYIRALAGLRGRNAEWAERAVRESLSASAEEALALNVVELVASSSDEVLRRVDGRTVHTAVGEVVLRTADAQIVPVSMNLPERILHVITNPDIALLLLTIGTIGIIAELYNPGTWIPGTVGVIALLLAFAALGNLPTNWVGAGLVMLAVLLLVAEAQAAGVGIFAAGAVASFILGALFMFRPLGGISPTAPTIAVNPGFAVGIGTVVAGFGLVVLRSIASSRRARVATGAAALVGAFGIARTDLNPTGIVQLPGEEWSAVAEGAPISAGRRVRVTRVEGVTLRVQSQDHPVEDPTVGAQR